MNILEKYIKIFFPSLKSLRKELDPELDRGPLVRGADPYPHQNVTDPEHPHQEDEVQREAL